MLTTRFLNNIHQVLIRIILYSQKIGSRNNLKIFGRKKTTWVKQESQNRLLSPSNRRSNHIGEVMVSVLASSAVDRGLEPRSGQTKD